MRKLVTTILGILTVVIISVSYSNAESTIYFIQTHPYLSTWHYYVTFNGDTIDFPGQEPLNPDTKSFKKYPKAFVECTIKNPGRLVVTKEFHWMDKPYHDEITLDLEDGETYYLESMHGFSNKMNLLKTKDGEKALNKAKKDSKKNQIFEKAVIYEN